MSVLLGEHEDPFSKVELIRYQPTPETVPFVNVQQPRQLRLRIEHAVPGSADERAEVQPARSIHVRSSSQQSRDGSKVPFLNLHE